MRDIKEKSIAHIITNGKLEILKYDFEVRKRRREGKPMDLNVCRENLKLLEEIFDKHTITFFLLFGTCLGAVRDNNFISYDIDTDIGVYMKDRDKILSIVGELERVGFEPFRTTVSDDLLSIMRKDEHIDIYFFQKKTDEHYRSYWGCNIYRVYGDHLDKLDAITFLGEKYNIPQNVNKYLAMLYGLTWRIPIKGMEHIPGRSTFRFICRRMMCKLRETLARIPLARCFYRKISRIF